MQPPTKFLGKERGETLENKFRHKKRHEKEDGIFGSNVTNEARKQNARGRKTCKHPIKINYETFWRKSLRRERPLRYRKVEHPVEVGICLSNETKAASKDRNDRQEGIVATLGEIGRALSKLF